MAAALGKIQRYGSAVENKFRQAVGLLPAGNTCYACADALTFIM